MQSRVEEILMAMLGQYDKSELEPPQSRGEALLLELLNHIEDLEAQAGKLPIYICTTGEYDPVTEKPTILDPQEDVFYLVPGGSTENLYVEWVYVDNDWEKFGSATIDLSSYVTFSDLAENEASSTASVAHPAGDVFSYNNKLYKATANIGVGATITPGTNCVLTNVDDTYVKFTDAPTNAKAGVAKVDATRGIKVDGGFLTIAGASDANIKAGSNIYEPVTPSKEHAAVFYGLAKAAGDNTQSQSNNAVGAYTDNAKLAIRQMIGAMPEVVDEVVSGTAVTISAQAGKRYLCGEVSTISFTPSQSGICEVIFTSGSSAAILTLPNTVKMPDWFDPTSLGNEQRLLETNTVYEISIADGVYGAVMTWAV